MQKGFTVGISDAEIVEMILRHLASVRAVPTAAIQTELELGGGDLEIDSKQGQVVAILIELDFGLEGLIRVEDQVAQNLTSVLSLQRLVSRRLADHRGGG